MHMQPKQASEPVSRSNAGRSSQRWQDGRTLADEIMPTLPGPSHCCVLWTCWFFGKLTPKGLTVFDLTKSQIAVRCNLKERRVQEILRELEAGQVIATRKDGFNQGGRGLGSERIITWNSYTPPKGASQC
jgi:hypothetical protein